MRRKRCKCECNFQNNGSEEVKNDEVPEEKAAVEDPAPDGDTQTETEKQPVYKLVSKYFSERYEGNEKEDREGNSLEA